MTSESWSEFLAFIYWQRMQARKMLLHNATKLLLFDQNITIEENALQVFPFHAVFVWSEFLAFTYWQKMQARKNVVPQCSEIVTLWPKYHNWRKCSSNISIPRCFCVIKRFLQSSILLTLKCKNCHLIKQAHTFFRNKLKQTMR